MPAMPKAPRRLTDFRDNGGYLSRRHGHGPWFDVECGDCGDAVAAYRDPEGLWADCSCGVWTGYVSQ